MMALGLLPLTAIAQHRTTLHLTRGVGPHDLSIRIEMLATTVLTGFNKAYYYDEQPALEEDLLTDAAQLAISELWTRKAFKCSEIRLRRNLIRRYDGNYEIRDIPLTLRLADGKTHREYAVMVFTPSGRLDDVRFGMDLEQRQDILRNGSNVVDARREAYILDFLERFGTAYNRKDLDLIEKVFSDNALIITGKVVDVSYDAPELLKTKFDDKRVELMRTNKTNYMARLREVFRRNEFVEVDYHNIELRKHHRYEEIYGVTLFQSWSSSTYSDAGYLFLLIDFHDEAQPLIHVRAWQPDIIAPDDAITLEDFEIIE